MKPTKYSFGNTNKIDLGTKIIYKYPTPTKDFDVGVMSVNGRHPEDPKNYIFERECSFVMYVLSGGGTVYAGSEEFSVKAKDVVFCTGKE